MAYKSFPIIFSKRVFLSLLALLSIPLAIAYTSSEIENREPPPIKTEAAHLPQISVAELISEIHQSELFGHGEAKARFELTLVSQLTGEIDIVHSAFERGQALSKGHVLAQIDALPYEQARAAAELSLAEAELNYQQERRESERAEEEWRRLALGENASPLLLRTPQMEVAKARLKEAKASLKQAERNLEDTQIRSPFDALLVERHIAPGQFVQAGERVATLYSRDQIDIHLNFPMSRWGLLPPADDLIGKGGIQLTNAEGDMWLGVVTHVDGHIDPNTRQRGLTISVVNPEGDENPLLPGTFLSVRLPGAKVDGVFAIPASSLSSEGQLWYVGDDAQLGRFVPDILFQNDGTVYVKNPFAEEGNLNYATMNLVLQPSVSLVAGQKVEPIHKILRLAGSTDR